MPIESNVTGEQSVTRADRPTAVIFDVGRVLYDGIPGSCIGA